MYHSNTQFVQIEGFNRILNQFRLRQCVKQLEKEERGQKNTPEQPRKPSKEQKEKDKPPRPKKNLECNMVEDIDEIIDITITIDEDKTNETKQKKLKRFDENTLATVKDLIKEFKYHKALELLDSFIKKDESKGRVQIDPSVREKQLQKLFPLPKQTQLKLDFRPYQKQFFTFSENEIFEAICNLDTTKACGPCGISNKYIKDMRYNKHFLKCLKALYEELYNNPTKMSEILPMFEFKIALIPKEDKISKRPVCVQNSLCNVLNSIILKRKDLLPRKFCKEQHLFDKNSMQQCKLDARKLSKKSVVMKIDIQNAFNETQLETLLYGMETQLVPMQSQLYICGLTQAQNCLETASYNLIQGSNLSSLCFSYAVEPILEELKKKYRISCYADDIIIEIGQSSEKEVIDFATSLFSKYGFTINEKKCFSTANDNVITFDGINISSTENDPRLHTSKKLTQTAEEIYSLIEQLLERGLGRSQALGIFLVSLIPKINWALRIEDYVKETIQDYKRIDELMAQTFYLITNPRQFTEEDFMGEQRQITIQNFINIMSAPLNRNGFNCILPGRNFEITQKLNAAEQLQYKDLFVKLKEHNEQQNCTTLITNMDSFAAQVLHKYHDLTNMEFQRAIDIMFDTDTPEPRNHAHICPLCQKHITDPNHAVFCNSGAGYAIKRHNKAQYDLVEHLPSKYKPQLSPTYNQYGKARKGNKDDPGDPPDEQNGKTPILKGNADISIEYQNKHYFWDLCICQNNSTMNREYKSKLETHAKNYKVHTQRLNTTTHYKRQLNNTSRITNTYQEIHQKPTEPFKPNRKINTNSTLQPNSILQSKDQITLKKRISLNTIRLRKQPRPQRHHQQQLISGNIHIQTQDMKKPKEIAQKKQKTKINKLM
ncbi:RT/endonuclease [Hexamita inflata]|uniref:RT/endonuclease n=1 Tax=Hexamita inflata TaxID=28002 RepID=A0ABP1MTL7_9EUKA